MKFYFIFAWEGTEPEIYGPFPNADERFKNCLECANKNGTKHSYFWLDENNGKMKIGNYSSKELESY